ncbi:hypothetical protein [Paenibacillus sp. NPDC057967]|uniref:hypothetical protein n=1 Tax=Paenibacillus sp. NPDC057967 TaxID=3346293 RepID=UPI0036DA4927
MTLQKDMALWMNVTSYSEELVWVVNDWNKGEDKTYVLNKQANDSSSPYLALDLRAYKMTEGKRLARDKMSYVTIK